MRRPRPVPGKPDSVSRPGLPAGLVEAQVRRQGNACTICGRQMAPPFIDHDHELAKTHPHPDAAYCVRCWRGLICGHCNSMLGFARDEPETLERGAAYVRAFRERQR